MAKNLICEHVVANVQVSTVGLDPQQPVEASELLRVIGDFLARHECQTFSLYTAGGYRDSLAQFLEATGACQRMRHHYDDEHTEFDAVRKHSGTLGYAGTIDESIFLVMPPTHIRRALRVLVGIARKNLPILILCTPRTGQHVLPLRPYPFEDARPIVVSCFPCAGTDRFKPIVERLLAHFNRTIRQPQPIVHNGRLLDSLSGDELQNTSRLQQAVNDNSKVQICNLNYWDLLSLHDPITSDIFLDFPDVRSITLMRDPRDIVTSYYHRLYGTRSATTEGSYIAEDDPALKEERFLQLIEGGLFQKVGSYFLPWPPLREIARSFHLAKQLTAGHVVAFEDLHANPHQVVHKLMQWLDHDPCGIFPPVGDETIQEWIDSGSFEHQSGASRTPGQFGTVLTRSGVQTSLRRGVPGDWRNHFSERVREVCKNHIGAELISLGYESGLNW